MSARQSTQPALRAEGDSEAQLVAALKRHDDGACELLVRRYGARMLAIARRLLNDPAAAEDCVQEAFLKAFRRIDGFEGRSSLATWLHRITVNLALMRLRSRQHRSELSIDDLQPVFDAYACRTGAAWDGADAIERHVYGKQVHDLVKSKIAELPEDYRVVLMLRDIEEFDTAQVADMLEINEGTVKVRLHRARAALKKLLEPALAESRS